LIKQVAQEIEMTQLEKLSEKLSSVPVAGGWHSTGDLVQEVEHRFFATIYNTIQKYGFRIGKRRGVIGYRSIG
jgi:hypothetical protein